jgi:hypothetical protein
VAGRVGLGVTLGQVRLQRADVELDLRHLIQVLKVVSKLDCSIAIKPPEGTGFHVQSFTLTANEKLTDSPVLDGTGRIDGQQGSPKCSEIRTNWYKTAPSGLAPPNPLFRTSLREALASLAATAGKPANGMRRLSAIAAAILAAKGDAAECQSTSRRCRRSSPTPSTKNSTRPQRGQ